MKQPSNIVRAARTAAGPGIRLPANDMRLVRAIAAAVNVRSSFRRRPVLLMGRNAAAEAIVRELRIDLFRIDLSAVVSQYIGETEKISSG